MDDLGLGLAGHRACDFDPVAVFALEKAGVARLTAGGCVEAGLIEQYATVFANSGDLCLNG
jgi:hypothetical protein